MRIDEDGVVRFQEGGPAYDLLERFMKAGGEKDVRAGGGPNDPNFNWGLYNSLVRDPYMGGYTGFGPDLTAALEGSLNPTGIMLDQDAIAKAIAEYQALQNLVQPAATTPAAGNQYITSMAQAATPGAAAPTTATGPSTVALPGAATGSLFDLLPAPIQGAVTGAGNIIGGIGNVIGRGTNALFELINAPLPSLVVLNPTNQSGTIVIGKPTGSATPTIVGSMPTSGAPVGVYTGNPFIDGVLQKVFSRSSPGQSDPNLKEIIKVVILEEIGKATGTNAGAISAAAQGDVQGLIDATTKVVLGVNNNVAELDERYKTQGDVDRAATAGANTTNNDTVVKNGGTANTTANTTKNDTVVKTQPTLEEVKVAKTTPVLNDLPLRVSPDDPPLKTLRVSPDGPPLRTSPAPDLGSPGGSGSPGSPATPIQQPQSTQDMYSVGTEQAGLADIGTPYDLNASLLDNIMRILAERDAGAEETELYGGGSVNRYNATDELIKLLRG
jgi:hypothetical protein